MTDMEKDLEERLEDKKSRTTPVKITRGLDEAVEMFLSSDIARLHGFRYKSDVVNAAVRELLQKYGFPRQLQETS